MNSKISKWYVALMMLLPAVFSVIALFVAVEARMGVIRLVLLSLAIIVGNASIITVLLAHLDLHNLRLGNSTRNCYPIRFVQVGRCEDITERIPQAPKNSAECEAKVPPTKLSQPYLPIVSVAEGVDPNKWPFQVTVEDYAPIRIASQKRRKTSLLELDKQLFLKLWEDSKKSSYDIAMSLGVSETSILSWGKAMHLPARKPKKYHRVNILSLVDLLKNKRHRDSLWLASKLGVSEKTVRNYINRINANQALLAMVYEK